MSITGIAHSTSNPALLAAQRAAAATAFSTSSSATIGQSRPGKGNDPAAIKKAATQFEAIILRQLLAPAIEPVMSGGIGGEKSAGGGIYGFMMTDVLADNLSKGGGLGLAKMLEKQFTPRGAATTIQSSAALKSQPLSAKTL